MTPRQPRRCPLEHTRPCSLFTVHCSLFTVHCSLFPDPSSLYHSSIEWRPVASQRGPSQVVCVSRVFQRSVFILSVAIFTALGLGFAMGEFGLFGVHAGGESDGAYRQMRVYAEVLKKVQTDYVTAPDINEVTTGALPGRV